jgi:hypothetical protein
MAKSNSDEPRTMKQHTTGGLKNQDADGAAWEAGKGAVIGASKACYFLRMSLYITDVYFVTVGNCLWRSWWSWIRSLAYIQRTHCTIQSVSFFRLKWEF